MDPAGDGLNPYAYVSGNPSNLIDPLGLCATKQVWNDFWDGRYFGTGYGQDALDWYADQWNRTGNPLYLAGGFFAALWTPDTWLATATTLASAGALGAEIKGVQSTAEAAKIVAKNVADEVISEVTGLPIGLDDVDNAARRITFRGDRASRAPEKIFKEGFTSKGDNMDLEYHTTKSRSDSGYISTSDSREIAEEFAGKNGYVYVTNSSRGIDVNSTLGQRSPFPEQVEVAFPNHIEPSEVVGAFPMKKGKPTGEFIVNPNYSISQ